MPEPPRALARLPGADAARNWLVEAKLVVSTPDGSARDLENRCGLVEAVNQAPTAVIDEVRLGRLPDSSSTEIVALSGVVTERHRNPVMALRCTMQQFEEIEVEDMKITAVEVGTVTGP